jgi:hypothetical protein
MDAEKVAFFKLLLRSNAADWVASVTTMIGAYIVKAFEERLVQTDLRCCNTLARYGRGNKIMVSPLTISEGRLNKFANTAKIETDDSGKNMLFEAVVQGLRPTVRAQVLQSGADNLGKLLKMARVAEVSEVPANISEPVLNTLLQV